MDYSEYRLANKAEIEALKSKYGNKYIRFQEEIFKFLDNMPLEDWISFTKKMSPQNIPIAVKVICHYIDIKATVYDYVEFNSTFTLIRRKKMIINKAYEIATQK